MKYWQVLILVVLAGSAGGIISAIASLLDPGKTESKDPEKTKGKTESKYEATKGVPLGCFISGRGILGIGGAFAITLAMIVAGRYKDDITTANLLFMTSVCVVAGFIGQRMLTAVAKRVEDQIAKEV